MSENPESPEYAYYRCSHCKGFYETDLPACKYCEYKTILLSPDGKPRIFPDRATCRAIQIAEFEQLPPEAIADPFKPAADEFTELCGCLHCGPFGPPFEAIEMRWIVNEQIWACPCTTCGGRGYTFDIHPLAQRWECAHCHHKWKPPGGNAKRSNCKCPNCGSDEANGWFMDEHSEEEIEAMTEEEYAAAFGQTREEEEREYREFSEKMDKEREEKRAAGLLPDEPIMDDAIPWEDPLPAAEDFTRYDPEARAGEETDDEPPSLPRLPDDIDFPRERNDSDPEGPMIDDKDIPF